MNRFFDTRGDISRQLSPWALAEMGLPAGTPRFQLVVPLRFRSDIAGGVIVVEAGFVSDLASIPAPLRPVMNTDDNRIALGAWFHDKVYKVRGKITLEDGRTVQITRKQADEILCFECMAELGADKFVQDAVYEILRKLGDGWLGDGLLERLS